MQDSTKLRDVCEDSKHNLMMGILESMKDISSSMEYVGMCAKLVNMLGKSDVFALLYSLNIWSNSFLQVVTMFSCSGLLGEYSAGVPKGKLVTLAELHPIDFNI